MPIEIKELHISIKVSEDNNINSSNSTGQTTDIIIDEQRLIQTCVEQVLAILKDKQDR